MLERPETTVLDVISATNVTESLPVPQGEVFENYPALTQEEDTFALAIIECGGNIKHAYALAFGPDPFALARGNELLGKPAVALRVRSITDAIKDDALISVGSHLQELADIRDLAKRQGEVKTALAAERSRGEAVGIYQKHDAAAKGKGGGQVNVQINMASKHDVNI